MSEKPESWYVFDINPEHVDPRLPQWLLNHGIVMRVNAMGRTPGVVANTLDELPGYFRPSPDKPVPVLPVKIQVSSGEFFPNLRELIDHHDSIHGKPYRFIREPLGEDFDRGAKLGDLIECLQGWLSEMLITLHRIMECDRAAFNYEGEEEIKNIVNAIASLQTQYFEATSTQSNESVRANILKYKIEQRKKSHE